MWVVGAVISAAITIVGLICSNSRRSQAFTDNSLTGTPCATSWPTGFVTEVTVKPIGEINGSNDTTQQEVLLQLQGNEINRVLDGDTIDVTIDLGFDL